MMVDRYDSSRTVPPITSMSRSPQKAAILDAQRFAMRQLAMGLRTMALSLMVSAVAPFLAGVTSAKTLFEGRPGPQPITA